MSDSTRFFDPCARPGCGHSRWSHDMSGGTGPCRAGPDTYECGCRGFVEPVKNALENVLVEALAIAAEETPLEHELRAQLSALSEVVRVQENARKALSDDLAIAREYEAELLSDLEIARGEAEALRVRLHALADEWDKDPGGGFGGRGPCDCARELREALEEP